MTEAAITLLEYLHPAEKILAEMLDYRLDAGPRSSGVYFLAHGPALVYVGSSKNVSRRLAQHHEQRRKRFTNYAVIEVPEQHVLAVEGFYVLLMDWPYYNMRLLSAHFAIEHLVPAAKDGSLWAAANP